MLIASGVFITVFATHAQLGKLPLQSLIKDRLNLGPEAMADFFAVAAFALYLKPLAGLLSDRVPLFGTRRYHYLLLASIAGALSWSLLAATPVGYAPLLLGAATLYAVAVLGNAVVCGLLVDEGQRRSACGRLSALRVAMLNGAVLAAGPVGGWLAARPFGLTCAIGALLMLGLAVASVVLLAERPATAARGATEERAAPLPALLQSRAVWSATVLTFLFYAAPGFSTVLYYHRRDALALSSQQIGLLAALNGGAGILAACCYMRARIRLPLRTLLALGIVLYAASSLFYLGYRSLPAAFAVEVANGFIGTLGLLTIQELAVRATPRGSEASVYALILGLANLGISLSEMAGTRIQAHFRLSFGELVVVSAVSSALALAAIPLLPRSAQGSVFSRT